MKNEIVEALPQGLLCWYDFGVAQTILCIGMKEIVGILKQKGHSVVELDTYEAVEQFHGTQQKTYDYIIGMNILDYAVRPVHVLSQLRQLLKVNGTLLLSLNNRLGLRFFCGDRDPFTQRSFDGIEKYRNAYSIEEKRGRYYSKSEMKEYLGKAGFENNKFYSVLPSSDCPQLIYAEGSFPNEDLGVRYFPRYHYPASVFMEERMLYKDIIDNGMFHSMANAYLIECCLGEGKHQPVQHVTTSMDRGKQNALATIIKVDNTVEKRTIYSEQQGKLEALNKNMETLEKRGITVVKGRMVDAYTYVMPYVEAQSALTYLRSVFLKDIEMFEVEIQRFIDKIYISSECIETDGELGIIMENGYYDLVPINAFYLEGEYVFYDQEFCISNMPLNILIMRTLDLVYGHDTKMNNLLPKAYFYKKYGLEKCIDRLREIETSIYKHIRKLDKMETFLASSEAQPYTIAENRVKINYSVKAYKDIFVNIFDNKHNKRCVVFGAGNYAKQCLQTYKYDYHFDYVVDSNEAKWGGQIEGLSVYPPEKLKEDDVKVIICIKNYIDIIQKLEQLGVKDYSVYNPNVSYKIVRLSNSNTDKANKLYNVGYIAGVFDLLHVGHMNLIKKAKQMCNYLIVGVVSDEGVRKYKKIEPIIPEDERMQLLKDCRYTDEVFILPVDWADSMTAHKLYQFDCQFSGSDYEYDEQWLKMQKRLREKGVDMVFLPYTQTTSSSKIREKIICHKKEAE